jgi:hypothetical protein
MGQGGNEFPQKTPKRPGITPTIEACVQLWVLKTTLKAMAFEKRRGILNGYTRDDEIYKAVGRLGTTTVGRKTTGNTNLH